MRIRKVKQEKGSTCRRTSWPRRPCSRGFCTLSAGPASSGCTAGKARDENRGHCTDSHWLEYPHDLLTGFLDGSRWHAKNVHPGRCAAAGDNTTGVSRCAAMRASSAEVCQRAKSQRNLSRLLFLRCQLQYILDIHMAVQEHWHHLIWAILPSCSLLRLVRAWSRAAVTMGPADRGHEANSATEAGRHKDVTSKGVKRQYIPEACLQVFKFRVGPVVRCSLHCLCVLHLPLVLSIELIGENPLILPRLMSAAACTEGDNFMKGPSSAAASFPLLSCRVYCS